MVSVDEVKKFLDFISNKLQSGSISPDEFNIAARRANFSLFKKNYGLSEDYQPGQPIPARAYEVTQKIKDDMRVFKKTEPISVDNQGRMTIPSDYVHKLAIDYKKITNVSGSDPNVKIVPVETIDDDKFTERRNSSLKAPTKDRPICNFHNTYVQFAPTDLKTVDFTYLRLPAAPVWGYTTVNTVPIYDPATSTDFEWPEILTDDLTWLIIGYVGINLRENELAQYSMLYKTEGA